MAKQASAKAEGSRWINQRPASEDVAEWFVKNAPIADELDPADYVTGVTLIPAKEKPKVLRNGTVMDGDEQLVFTPYVKVETRVAYFWDLMRAHKDEWVGIIQAEPLKQFHEAGFTNDNLPAGAFRMPVKKADGKTVDFIGFSYEVAVYEKGSIEKVRIAEPGGPPGWKRAQMGQDDHFRVVGVPVMKAPAGSKVVPLLTKWGEDPFALMKAQTGAIGRALGMAGMLVIPGSGVATAEDVQEAQQQGAAGAIDATLEADVERGTAAQGSLKEHAVELIARLQSDYPDRLEKVQEWAEQRKLNLTELTEESPALRGVVRQLERALAEGES